MILTQGLTFAYPGGADLNFADVDVPQGGVLLLRGPSGAGKSTWLALAAGLLQAGAGRLEVAGRLLSQADSGAARPRASTLDRWRADSIGFLPQRLYLSPALSVFENLALAQWAAGRPEDRVRITQALVALGVDALAGRMPSQLSGGQAQRVALARAVLLQPRVILADEPTASLDDAAAEAAAQLLQSTARSLGATLVIASHDARLVQFFSGASELRLQPLAASGQKVPGA